MTPLRREDIFALYEHGGIEAVADVVVALVESLTQRLTAVEAELQVLREQVSRNSRNSSKPPSSDGLKRVVQTRVASGRKQGGQPGHKGHHLSLVDTADEIILHTPLECPDCGTSLGDVAVTQQERRQIIDLPPPRALVTEHRAQTKHCPCCRRQVKARFPDHVAHRIVYGANLSAMAVFLAVEHAVSLDRVADIIATISGYRPAAATIYSMIENCWERLEPAEARIIEGIVASEVVHFDESSVRTGTKIHWLHSASTETLTYLQVHRQRGSEAMNHLTILPRFQGVAVHDFWKPYLTYDCSHSFCNAHLLRELQWLEEERKHLWAARIAELLRAMLRQSHDPETKHSDIAAALKHYDELLDDALRQHPRNDRTGKRGRTAQSKEYNLLQRLKTYKHDILRFLHDKRVPFTNNLAERDIRPIKTKMKVSGCFRSTKGADFYCRIRSYCATVKKQHANLWNALSQAFHHMPFIPAL